MAGVLEKVYPPESLRRPKFYRIHEKLGKGSYGKVYRVSSPYEGQEFALKIINLDDIAGDEREEKLNIIRGIGILASNIHDNIIRYWDSWQTAQEIYIVTEYYQNSDLLTFIERNGTPSEPQLIEWIRQLALALKCVIKCILLAILIILVSVVVHKVNNLSGELKNKSQPAARTTDSLSVRERFPGYFRNEQEQAIFQEKLKGLRPVKSFISEKNAPQLCSVQCTVNSNYTPNIPITPHDDTPDKPITATPLSHGCCYSEPVYISPDYLVDIHGVNRTIAQFGGGRQYFLQENCSQVSGCEGCTCNTLTTLVTAVYVVSGTSYDVAWFEGISCCKCINS